ncbi:acyl-CoA dehydrogenase [Streptomyces sp. NPDC021100]|uniref:acyl-CoA dehydrogenase family protein n=1 Tax=Streptomyces sp. NPDC021100 TaxID=3365114 RepID=UPI00379EB253
MPITTAPAAPSVPPPAAPRPSGPGAEELADLLFRDGPEDTHGHWRAAVSAEVFRYRPGLPAEERQRLAYARLRALNAGLPSPGRLARDPRGLAALHEWTAVVDGATATVAGIHYNLFLGSLLDDDVSPPRDLTEFTTLARVGTFLCTEQAHGNDVAALETTARHDPEHDGFVLHTPTPGARKFMPNTGAAGGPKSAVVAARLLAGGRDHGVFLFLTPLSDHRGTLPGVTVEALPERTGSPVDHCVTAFDHVRLPRTALVQGPHGRLLPGGGLAGAVGNPRKRVLHAIRRVTAGKLCMSAATLGGCRAALAIAVRYAHLRTVSGPVAGRRIPLAAHRSHHAPLLGHVAAAYAMTFLHRAVTERRLTAGPDEQAETERLVAVAKGWITWRARDITLECRERCGARALFPVNGLAEFPANADGAITAEGDNLAIWCKAAAEMVFGHDLVPDTAPATGGEDLTDPRFLRGLLTADQRQWHASARSLLRSAPGTDGHGHATDALGRWNHASDAALNMVRSAALGLAADAFLAAGARAASPGARAVLDELCALFLLEEVTPRSGRLLADGKMTAEQVRALPTAVRTLTARLAPLLTVLTDAFRIPAEHLASLPLLADEPAAKPSREPSGEPSRQPDDDAHRPEAGVP